MTSHSHHLSPSEFLTRLTALFTQTHATTHGSVFLTQKLLPASPSPSSPDSSKILIRASDGLSKENEKEKTKISTIVPTAEGGAEEGRVDEFFAQYAEVCKKGMEGLRKRDRKAKGKAKKKKAKGKAAGTGGGSGGPG